MSLYTSIYFVPRDRSWIAGTKFIRELANKLQIESLDNFVIYSREHPYGSAPDDADDNGKLVLNRSSIFVQEAVSMIDANNNKWSLMMLPLGGYVRELSNEILDAIPQDLSHDFLPWDASIFYGRWRIFSYDEGGIVDQGRWAFTLSANGCPTDLKMYLAKFPSVKGVRALKTYLEAESDCEWETLINLT